METIRFQSGKEAFRAAIYSVLQNRKPQNFPSIPKGKKIIDYTDIIEQRLALAKWMTSNRTWCVIDNQDYKKIVKLLVQSELFGHGTFPDSSAIVCTNSIRLALIELDLKPQEISEIEVEVHDIMEAAKNEFLRKLKKFKDVLVFVTTIFYSKVGDASPPRMGIAITST